MEKQKITSLFGQRWRAGSMLLSFLLLLAACSTGSAGYQKQKFEFAYGQDEISGVLLLPGTPGPHPAIIFVHGDGEAVWDQYGYYTPLQEAMLEAGFAVLSWDKPGVGKSGGNWLNYSMQDRADMLIHASNILKSHDAINPDVIGLWGISQAGWVMPLAIAESENFAFMISVSGAINWLQQGQYYMIKRLEAEGYRQDEIAEALAFSDKGNAFLLSDNSYEDYIAFMKMAPSCCREIMSERRWKFVKKNINSDARAGLETVQVPVLAIFGGEDRNVDIIDSVRVYEEALKVAGNEDVTIRVYKGADHNLIPIPDMNKPEHELSGFGLIMKIRSEGKDAFAPGYIDETISWLQERFGQD
jgi:uncharacterized protein